MSNREMISYNLFTNKAVDGTSTKKINTGEFRHLGVTISTSNTAFTGTLKIKGSRKGNGEDIDFTIANTQVNPWSYLQLINNNDGGTLIGNSGLILTTSSDETYNLAVNVDGFNWITVELSGYTAGDVNVDAILYNNQ